MPYQNQRNNYEQKPVDPNAPAMNRPMYQPKDLFNVPDGILVKLKNMKVLKNPQMAPCVNISWTNSSTLLKNDYGLVAIEGKPAFLNSLIRVILGVTDNKQIKTLREYALTEALWQEKFAERVVLVRYVLMPIVDRQTGEKKDVPVLEAFPPPAGYSTEPVLPSASQPVIERESAPVADAVPAAPKNAKEWFAGYLKDDFWRPLVQPYAPKSDNPTDREWILAKVKVAGKINEITAALPSKLDDLKPDCGKYLEPWTLEDCAAILESDVAGLMPLTLKDVRDNMSAIFAGEQ